MKKFACLVLSLVLCLSMLCAVAEVAVSPACGWTVAVLSDVPADFNLAIAAVSEEELAAVDMDAVAAAYGETDQTIAVYDAAWLKVEGYVEGQGDLVLALTFAAEFTAEQKVVVVAQGNGYDYVDGTVTLPETVVAAAAQAPVMLLAVANVIE